MDPYEATKIVFTRIQHLDPENASKIMGLLLIQDHGEKEMIRLAFGPESLLHSLIFKSKQDLGISSSSSAAVSTPSTPTSATATANSNSSRLFLPSGLKIPSSLSISSIASPSSASSPSWAPSSVFPDFHSPVDDQHLISPSGSSNTPDHHHLFQEQLGFLSDQETSTWGPHRRSCSVSDITFGGDDPNSGALATSWKPCLYFARGFCKNGSSCRFLHAPLGDFDSSSISGSGSVASMEQCHELLRSKSMQHQKLVAASQLMAASSFPLSNSKAFNFIVQQHQQNERAAAAALLMGEDIHKFSRSRLSRGDYLMNGDTNPGSRQIYLTFPADSTFKEEDVSNYFSIYGPVQDVRIPYQQKRMFGFVTFVFAETVKIILTKGNPHFVCDARVLVKPYKEKGKVPDKFSHHDFRKQQQQLLERGEFSACNSPTGLDNPRDPFDNQIGSRMMYNATQEMLWRKKLEEQNDFQQALELQSRRLMGLQLDIKRSSHHRALSTGAAPFPSPTYSPTYNQPFMVPDRISPDRAHDGSGFGSDGQITQQPVYESDEIEKERSLKESSNGKESPLSTEEGSLHESLEHNLPDSPFASPTKGNAEQRQTPFTNAELPSASTTLLATSALDQLSPFKSCYFPMPRFSTGPGAIGM